jgi:TBC1 domain family member 15
MTASQSKTTLGPPLSPSASFYDMSDNEEGEYKTIAHSSSEKGVKLLFSKSKVWQFQSHDVTVMKSH